MRFHELEPDENLDLKRFRSLPDGRWEAGILKMLGRKARVRMVHEDSRGFMEIDYWGGDRDTSILLLGFLIGLCSYLPETITERELAKILPDQNDKELGADFWDRLFKAGDQVRATYGGIIE
jgi:hypothetical protein